MTRTGILPSASVFGLMCLLSAAGPAFAHEATGIPGGFISGLVHPVFGWDHVIAMVAVGLWGAILGSPALWLLPVAFPLVMACGAILGIAGFGLPLVEAGIALSGLVLGLMVLFQARMPLLAAVGLVSVFAIFHGYAHGTELPEAADPFAYAAGFVIATGLLHLAGILLGLLLAIPHGRIVIRTAGAAIALAGAAFLAGVA